MQLCTACRSVAALRIIIVILASLLVLITLTFYSIDLYTHSQSIGSRIYWFSAGGFVLLTFPISISLIVSHLTHWTKPSIQKYVVRIIWMVPLYSIESWLALRFKHFALYIETLREAYEAYVVFSFLYFLIALLGEEAQLISILKEKPESRGRHTFPLNLILSPWIMGHELLHKCKVGVLQYVVIKNLVALAIVIMETLGIFHEGVFRLDGGYLYVCVISNISQIWALYCLILFYFALREDLQPWRPVGKFLCVKAVVFWTWWQSLLINVIGAAVQGDNQTPVKMFLSERGIETISPAHQEKEWTKGLQDYLICVEMLIASIAFTYAFTYKDYEREHPSARHAKEQDNGRFFSALLQSSVPDDFFGDLRRMAKGEGLGSVDSNDLEASKSLMKPHLIEDDDMPRSSCNGAGDSTT